MVTAKRPAAKKTVRRTEAAGTGRAVIAAPVKGDKSPVTLARYLCSWTDFVLNIANTAADLSFRVATAKLTRPSHRAAALKAGGLFRDLRERAGLTRADLGQAINLKAGAR